MNKILITRKIPQQFIEQLEQIGDVVMWDKELTPMPRETFLSEVKDATACFITLSESVDEEVLKEASDLKIIANMAVGYDNIDVVRANDHDITVTNTPDVLTETTAELGFTLMLTVARRIIEAERYVQEGQWQSWGPYLLSGKDVHGSTVGIYGMGDIGRAFARRLKGFNTRILYHNRTQNPEAEKELDATYVSFETLLKESDFVICTAPLTPQTENQFDSKAFNLMKNDAIFINIGRGAIVDETALVEALRNHTILGCGLDVLRQEPIDVNHPLLKLDNAVIVPHIGSASRLTRDRMVQLCVNNILAVLNHQLPITPVKVNN
ncbi:2-hydroxyacid dehydrogenase [Staphylococcus capitis]|uniref:2-hydroxyacid dehydrogenase n=1 Tax=Staphylococcus capitis TaxID=29388 RepID=UPI00064A6639|nr:D-glycerate dehydrogenase [Staphylococcus capitis]AKL91350.1 Glyoxylate/hydroxypyruvate reductase B [Staphylococcus capitis subsp. capitis]MCC0829174.1 D-glycerate dehydrogenase [Staphylococcus capitis]MCC3744738.1 D-glycerate dehydrogenase [Staphylococcus capitis]MCC9116745.1 D-glycerate dehydrogenase [Staphylococcus capitis]MCC9142877.1 D-glycerate dehydrogenase [Staphylococcus capitis]